MKIIIQIEIQSEEEHEWFLSQPDEFAENVVKLIPENWDELHTSTGFLVKNPNKIKDELPRG